MLIHFTIMDLITVLIRSFLLVSFFAETASVALPSHLQVNSSQAFQVSLTSGTLSSRLGGGLTPTIRRRVKLYCRIGFSLAVTANNTVRGVDETYCLKTSRCLFELQSYGKSLVRLKNIKSGTFIAINNNGKVFVTPNKSRKSLFSQRIHQATNFETFSSVKYHSKAGSRKNRSFYLAFRKDGTPKKAFRTHRLHKSTQFITLDQGS